MKNTKMLSLVPIESIAACASRRVRSGSLVGARAMAVNMKEKQYMLPIFDKCLM